MRKIREERRKRCACAASGGFWSFVRNLKFKSFENAADCITEVAPGGKQIFTVSLIHAEERLIDIVHARLFFLRDERGKNNAVPVPHRCVVR